MATLVCVVLVASALTQQLQLVVVRRQRQQPQAVRRPPAKPRRKQLLQRRRLGQQHSARLAQLQLQQALVLQRGLVAGLALRVNNAVLLLVSERRLVAPLRVLARQALHQQHPGPALPQQHLRLVAQLQCQCLRHPRAHRRAG